MNIFLPALEGPEATATAPDAEIQRAEIKGTVLVVDDDQDFLDITTDILRLSGLDAIPARGAARALETYRVRGAEIDLVLLDMMMPEMDGVEVFRLLRTMNRGVKVVVCSGYSKDGKASRIITEGACGFLQKPFDGNQLLKVVSDSLKYDSHEKNKN